MKLGMEALMWISCSERLLKADELCHALAVEVGTTDLNVHNAPSIRTLLGCTLGLVMIDEQSSIVRLLHFTLPEYIAAHNLFITPYSMRAEISLTYLNFQSSFSRYHPISNTVSPLCLMLLGDPCQEGCNRRCETASATASSTRYEPHIG